MYVYVYVYVHVYVLCARRVCAHAHSRLLARFPHTHTHTSGRSLLSYSTPLFSYVLQIELINEEQLLYIVHHYNHKATVHLLVHEATLGSMSPYAACRLRRLARDARVGRR